MGGPMPNPARRFAELPISVVAILDELERRAALQTRALRERYEARIDAQRREVSALHSQILGLRAALQHAQNELQAFRDSGKAPPTLEPGTLAATQQRLADAFAPKRNGSAP